MNEALLAELVLNLDAGGKQGAVSVGGLFQVGGVRGGEVARRVNPRRVGIQDRWPAHGLSIESSGVADRLMVLLVLWALSCCRRAAR